MQTPAGLAKECGKAAPVLCQRLRKIDPNTPRITAWPVFDPRLLAKLFAKASPIESDRLELLRFFGAASLAPPS